MVKVLCQKRWDQFPCVFDSSSRQLFFCHMWSWAVNKVSLLSYIIYSIFHQNNNLTAALWYSVWRETESTFLHVFGWRSLNFLLQMLIYDILIPDFPEMSPFKQAHTKKGCKNTGVLWPPPPFPISSTHARTYTHRAHLTRHGYPKQQEQLICCSLACLAVISLALFTHTHSLPLSVKHTRAVSESLHTQTRDWMLWGLISVLRGLAATSQAHIPGAEATETNLCDRSADEHRLYTAGDDLCSTGGLRGAPTMSTWPAAATTAGRKGTQQEYRTARQRRLSGATAHGHRMPAAFVTFCSSFTSAYVRGPTGRHAHLLLNISAKT